MKKLLVLIPLLIISCNKKEVVTSTSSNDDSTKEMDGTSIENSMDSTNNDVVSIDSSKMNSQNNSETFRAIEGDKIIKTINGDMLPINFEDELTADHGQMIIKIKNFKGNRISGTVTSLIPGMNIRFNQIRMADGEYDGPFGAQINYDIKDKGEIWLIIGKNLMASSETTGKFRVSLN